MEECVQCHVRSDELRHCAQCQTTCYCSRACQKKHWPQHKASCRKGTPAQPATTTKDTNFQDCDGPSFAIGPGRMGSLETKTSPPVSSLSTTQSTCCSSECLGNYIVKYSSFQIGECEQCHKRNNTLRRCTQCQSVFYCSQACQTTDWPKHKTSCKKSVSSKPEGAPPGEKPKSGADNLQSCNMICKHCGKKATNMQKCGRCYEETYCSKDCQKQDWISHKVTCTRIEVITTEGYQQTMARERKEQEELKKKITYTEQFIVRHSILTGSFLGRMMPALTWADARSRATRLYPRKRVVDVLSDLDNDLLRIPNAEETVVLILMTSVYLHILRRGMFLEDSKGTKSLVLFYNSDDPEPYFRYEQLRSGNFLCIEHAYLHSFLDGTVGFRINNVNQVHIIES